MSCHNHSKIKTQVSIWRSQGRSAAFLIHGSYVTPLSKDLGAAKPGKGDTTLFAKYNNLNSERCNAICNQVKNVSAKQP